MTMDDQTSPAISVIMPCFNRAHGIRRMLSAYDRQAGDVAFEIIAVDDGSTDDTARILKAHAPARYSLRVEQMAKNSGPAAARNRGLAVAGAPIVAFVGDDICPSPDFIKLHVQAHQEHSQEEVAILGKIVWPLDLPRNTLMTHIDGVGAQQFSFMHMRHGLEYDYRHLYTSNVSMKRAFLKLNNAQFDTSFPYAAFEDAELGYRLSHRGLRIRYQSSILATHYHYYTVWTFTERQYKSGLMSWRFIQKHPAAITKVAQKKNLALMARCFLARNTTPAMTTAKIEARALQLAGFYEWQNVKSLDMLYHDVLQYFYYKGQLEGMFKAQPHLNAIRDQHANRLLRPALTAFLNAARAEGDTVPFNAI
jgi:glycosyltransferase involved in cell wall biosynthesis